MIEYLLYMYIYIQLLFVVVRVMGQLYIQSELSNMHTWTYLRSSPGDTRAPLTELRLAVIFMDIICILYVVLKMCRYACCVVVKIKL